MQNKDYTLGIILIIIGIVLFIMNIDFIPNDLLLLALGAIFLVGFYRKKSTGLLIPGLIITAIGFSSLIEDLVRGYDMSSLLFLLFLGIAFLIIYFMKNISGFVYPGCILPAIGIYSFIEDNILNNQEWLFFLMLSFAFYVIYFLEKRRKNIKWPLTVGTIILIFSALIFLTSEDVLNIKIWEVVGYLWPIILIIIGLRIIYNNYKMKNMK